MSGGLGVTHCAVEVSMRDCSMLWVRDVKTFHVTHYSKYDIYFIIFSDCVQILSYRDPERP